MPNLKSTFSQLWESGRDKAGQILDSTANKASRLWDETSNLMANDEAVQSFIEDLDSNQDGKVTAAELKAKMDENKDGYLDSAELEKLAIKAGAADLDQTTIKALAQSANAGGQVVLFAEEQEAAEPQAKPTTASTTQPSQGTSALATELDAEAEPGVAEVAEPPTEPAPKPVWKASQQLRQVKDSYRTLLPLSESVLPSREPDRLTGIRPGLFRIQEQEGNSCGTTSLSMLMKYFQGHTLENTVTTIDKYIRANGTFSFALPTGKINDVAIDGYTAPRDIVNYARERGLRAGMENNSSISQLKAYLDKGVPVMVLTDWNFDGSNGKYPTKARPDGESLHYVNVVGYEYLKAEGSNKAELHLVIANPHGKLQYVPEKEFDKLWSNLELKVGDKTVQTGFNQLMIAMLPRDEDAVIVAPDGSSRKAGDISIPTGSDGIKGWLAQKGSAVLQKAAGIQDDLAKRGVQLGDEISSGYQQDGVLGALRNLWQGDDREIGKLHKMAKEGSVSTRVAILNQLLDKGINRDNIQQLIYDILRETAWGKDFNSLIDAIDTRKLAERLSSDAKAGQVMAWIAKSEVGRKGATGPKFEAFASYMSENHRDGALKHFLDNDYTQKEKLLQKAPAALVRNMIEKLLSGITDSGEETAIYELFRATGWQQFEQVMSRLNMGSVAAELENTSQLGNLTAWVIDSGTRGGQWGNLSEILSHLESLSQYGRADDVLGIALTQSAVKDKLAQIPEHLRKRMIDLLDDVSRWRSDDAVAALKALKRL